MSYAAKLTKCEAEVARLTAEIAAMRERCGRLAASVLAWREYAPTDWSRCWSIYDEKESPDAP